MTEIQILPSFTLELPDLCVVVLIGVSGSGKSTFAAKHFSALGDPFVGCVPGDGQRR